MAPPLSKDTMRMHLLVIYMADSFLLRWQGWVCPWLANVVGKVAVAIALCATFGVRELVLEGWFYSELDCDWLQKFQVCSDLFTDI